MPRRFLVLLVPAFFMAAGCVKRVPASAGPDISVRAGQRVELGSKVKLPEGTRMSWSFGDGAEIDGSLVAHAWDVAGSYELKVTVSDPDGQQRSDVAKVEVGRPALLDVLGASVDAMLLIDSPGRRLSDFPLLLEKFFVSGQAANSTLAKINELLGFDPFDPVSIAGAGVDPDGSIGLLHVAADGVSGAVVAFPVFDRQKMLGTISQFFSPGAVGEQPAKRDPAIIVELGADKKPRGAYTFYAGHAWLCKSGSLGFDPDALLAAVRNWDSGKRLVDRPEFKRAVAGREKRGPVEIFVSHAFLGGQQAGPAAGVIDYLVADAGPQKTGLRVSGRLGPAGKTAQNLIDALRSPPPPPLGSYLPAGRHLFLKLSARLPDLLRTLADLLEPGAWKRWQQKLGGDGVLDKLLGCLGHNLVVGVRLVPDGLLRLTNKQKSRARDALEEVAIFELADAKALAAVLDGLADNQQLGGMITKQKRPGARGWQVMLGNWPTSLAIGGGFAIWASSESLIGKVAALVGHPGQLPAWWPKGPAAGQRQVFFADISGFIDDFKKAPPPPDVPSAAFIKAMFMHSLSQVESLGTLTLGLSPQKNGLGFDLELNIR